MALDLRGPGVLCIGSTGDVWIKGNVMNVVLKRVLIALILVVVCVVILAATKSYGIWVITGFAVFLFILGLLGKGKASDKSGEAPSDDGRKPGHDENT
jgi:hypothetical protein